MIRDALDSATADPDWGAAEMSSGGLGGLAPRVTERNLRGVYGPDGATVESVSALLAYRLVLLGNPRLEAGKVYEEEDAIIAEVVTKKEQALVARYRIDKKTGVWVPQG